MGWGLSIYLTELVLRRPELLRGAVFQEPPFLAMTSQPEATGASMQALVEQGMARGGPPAATEVFLRWVCGDEMFEAFDPEFRERCLGNGEVLFGLEMPADMSYVPDPAKLAEVRVPCAVTSGADNREPTAEFYWLGEASQWFAHQLGVPLVETAGGHVPQASHPEALVATLRPILRRLVQDPARPPTPSSMA